VVLYYRDEFLRTDSNQTENNIHVQYSHRKIWPEYLNIIHIGLCCKRAGVNWMFISFANDLKEVGYIVLNLYK
jgi:hypothetical protein